MIDTDKYEGHTSAPWMMGEYKGRPSIHAGNETFVRSIARGLNPSQTADHALLLDAPLLLAEVKRLYEMMDVLASFNIVKNAEQGFTQREWVEFVELAKRGAYEAQMEEEE